MKGSELTLEFSDLSGEVARMARRLAAQWPGIDAEDIEQEMNLKILENWQGITERVAGFGVDDAEGASLALGLAHRRGLQYCSQERTEYQMNSAQWIYTPNEIRALLPMLFDGDAWESAPARPSKGKEYLTADGLSILVMDMRNAYEALPERHQATILSVFRDGESPSSSTERMRVTRAIDAMTAWLNREVHIREEGGNHDGPGARTATSNAQAQYRTANDY